MSIKIGQKAPDFTLPDTEKKMHTLSGYRGKNVVLLFFPAAFTATCTKEMCQTRDELGTFNGLNAEVFGISVDMLFSLGRFKAGENINFPLLSDFNKETITAYGIRNEDFSVGYKGVAKRSSFVIDKDGIVRFAEVLPTPGDYPDFDGIKSALKSLN